MNCDNLFKNRRSNRYLSSETLDKEIVDAILEAGMKAPVAKGRYKDIRLYVYEKEKLEYIKKTFKESLGMDIFYDCSLLVIVAQKNETIELRNQNAGAIIENMLLEATIQNIGSVFIYSPIKVIESKKELYDLFNFDDEYKLISGAVFGKKISNEVRDVIHEIEVIR